VVTDTFGDYYANTSGRNSVLTDTNNWLKLTNFVSKAPKELDKDADDITGSDPTFSIDLSGDGMPQFPNKVTAYYDLEVDDNWLPSDQPVAYDVNTRVASGFPDPASYPDIKIKIVVV